MQKIEHSKYRNTALLFEMLNRQIAADLLNNREQSTAIALVREYFSTDTELGHEYALYEALLGERYESAERAKALIDEVLSQRRRLDEETLKRQKYALVGDIKEAYPFDEFFNTRVDSYREMASVYKLFVSLDESVDYRPQDLVECRYTLLEHMQRAPSNETESSLLRSVKDELKESSDEARAVRAMAQRLMVERFNEKYGSLNERQRDLLRRYINNVSNTNGLSQYIDEEVDRLGAEIDGLADLVESRVARIKVDQARTMIEELRGGQRVEEDQVQGLLMFYELIDRIKDAVNT